MSAKELVVGAVNDLTEEQAETLYEVIRVLFINKKEDDLSDSQAAFAELEKLKKKFTSWSTEGQNV